jgi:type III secretory pathway component EscR
MHAQRREREASPWLDTNLALYGVSILMSIFLRMTPTGGTLLNTECNYERYG